MFVEQFLSLNDVLLTCKSENEEEIEEILALMIYLAALMEVKAPNTRLEVLSYQQNYNETPLQTILIQILKYKLKLERKLKLVWGEEDMREVLDKLGSASPYGSFHRLSQRHLPAVWNVIREAVEMSEEAYSIEIPDSSERLDYVLKRLATDELDYFAVVQKIYNELVFGCELRLGDTDLTLGKLVHGLQAIWFLTDENLGVNPGSREGYAVQAETVEHYHLALSALFMVLMAARSEESIIAELKKTENRNLLSILIDLREEISARNHQYAYTGGNRILATSYEAYKRQLPCEERLYLIIGWSRQFMELCLYTLDSLIAVAGANRLIKSDNLIKTVAWRSKIIPEAEPGFMTACSHFEELVKPEYAQLNGYTPPGRVDSVVGRICCCATD